MKNLLIIYSFIFLSCQGSNQKSKTTKDTIAQKADSEMSQPGNPDEYVGTYEYIYPYNTEKSIENHYIVIEKKENDYFGLYYGTTDEFDYGREGYHCGFFVAPMDELDIDDETMNFVISVVNDDVFDKPVDLKFRSGEEAKNAGYKNWIQEMEFDPKNYIGSFEEGKIIFSDGFDEKVFKRIK